MTMSPAKAQTSRGNSVAKIYMAGAFVCALLSAGAYFFGISPAIARYDDHASRQTELAAAKKKAAGLLITRNALNNQLNATNEALNNLTLHLAPASTVNTRPSDLTA